MQESFIVSAENRNTKTRSRARSFKSRSVCTHMTNRTKRISWVLFLSENFTKYCHPITFFTKVRHK